MAKEDVLVLAIDAEQLRNSFETDPVLAHLLTHRVATMLARRLETAREKFARLAQSLDEVLRKTQE